MINPYIEGILSSTSERHIGGNKMSIIKVENLKKKYGKFEAVKGISFEVTKGEIFGLLGPNGAGKSTTIECMTGIKPMSSGTVTMLDKDIAKVGKKLFQEIGVQLQETSYQDKVKVSELCELFTKMYKQAIDYKPLLKAFDLDEKQNVFVQSLSGGQRQKLSIILALIGDPKIVFLDELTTGLDPKARREMWAYISKLRDMGKTVVMTTHYMEEANFLCDKIGIIKDGELMVVDKVEKVIDYAKMHHEVTFNTDKEYLDKLRDTLSHVAKVTYDEGLVKVASKEEDIISTVILTLNEHKVTYKNINMKRPTLEDAYIKLIEG